MITKALCKKTICFDVVSAYDYPRGIHGAFKITSVDTELFSF